MILVMVRDIIIYVGHKGHVCICCLVILATYSLDGCWQLALPHKLLNIRCYFPCRN